MFKKILNFICDIVEPKYVEPKYNIPKCSTRTTSKMNLDSQIISLRKAIKRIDDIIFDYNSSDNNDYEYDYCMNYWLSKRQRQQAWLAKLLRKKSRITGSGLDAIEARKLEILSGIILDKYTKRQMNGNNK